jgi:hypothetical protein
MNFHISFHLFKVENNNFLKKEKKKVVNKSQMEKDIKKKEHFDYSVKKPMTMNKEENK